MANLDVDHVIGGEQKGERPVLILQNDLGNVFSCTTIIAAITSSKTKKDLPTHYKIPKETGILPKDSIVLLEQIRTIDKQRLTKKVGTLPPCMMKEVERRLLVSVGILSKDMLNQEELLLCM